MSVFVDTNVLVYTRDVSEPDKQQRAQAWMAALWESRAGRTSVQVLNEFYVTVTRKLSPAMPAAEARADILDLGEWDPVVLTDALVHQAWTIEDRYGLSYWDSLIAAAAQAQDCGHLLTEDLQDGMRLDGVAVVNPFDRLPDDLI